jgi:RNA polymerase subunit RPABC4/transcription elongation factor Spt4
VRGKSELTPENILTIVVVYIGMVVAAFWLAMIIWAYRDMRARSRDSLAQIVVAVMVALLNLPGLLIYIFLRPRETLSEAYERSLEEEALLQEIEEKPVCPACGQRVREEWQACPSCHTRLKKPCVNCGRVLELSWSICPHCTANQANYRTDELQLPRYAPPQVAPQRTNVERRASESLEFVEGDEY